jgi:UDP:flavonoid glycosyltransferase YjiC (YdhE family)
VSIGAGVRLHKKASSGKIRRVVEEALLDPSLKRRAQLMATALSRKDGALTTAEALEALVKANDAPASSLP